MQNFTRLQNLVLRIILFLVWFDLMCFALILAGNIFKWSFFNESIGSAFFTVFGLSLGALAALAVLHVVLTLNIISGAIKHIAGQTEAADSGSDKRQKKGFQRLVIASVLGILLIVCYQGIVERNAARHKVGKIEKQLKESAESRLTERIIELIEQDAAVNKLYFVRDELLFSLEEERRSVTLLIPKPGHEGLIFYEITPWDYDYKNEEAVSKSLGRLFIPDDNERKQFEQLKKENSPFTLVNRFNIRSFYPILRNGKLELILLLDTSRTISSDYLMSRSKF
ncbi:MAG: hypothetical protein COV72_08240 [Candidatus Omnitrophica bacterium CG11_big_fil_rev_8_21_14_0_20_42_13]|uniref:Uncharacterized protein n=1 Tax=Candidatus Ghiorseimicrobium undicola TaxID=1974746 RepID=A0A2H0LVK7_9BACT|nr:MAG: hypothetical protein COV72_08240 [Candidatus Omnitrophica bacterium CG11_big_fil_rev_8_21_14_0_20_42_13]